MIRLVQVRNEFFDDTTLGTLMVQGKDTSEWLCETLEDVDRELEKYPERKVKGATAIPRGTYKVAWTFSNRFQRYMLELLGVPGFHGIRFHAGNTHIDTDGCILGGNTRHRRTIRTSRVAVERVEKFVVAALERGEKVTWKIL